MEETKKKKKIGKNWIVAIVVFVLLCGLGVGFLYYRNFVRPFTRSEYIKEVIVQNDDFNNLIDDFLDKVSAYKGTQEDIEKVDASADRVSRFVSALREKLGPRVGAESKEHYEKMMVAYGKYLEAIDMYKKVVPKDIGEERAQQMHEAQLKLIEAQKDMKNL